MEFMEDVALATDLDKDTADQDRVALMTIHLARVGVSTCICSWYGRRSISLSAMSMSTRSESLKKSVVCFYVALTRAEHQAYLTYAQSLPLG
jgi:DNA helicase-2/ATP-dependent DNA helicase PcrA